MDKRIFLAGHSDSSGTIRTALHSPHSDDPAAETDSRGRRLAEEPTTAADTGTGDHPSHAVHSPARSGMAESPRDVYEEPHQDHHEDQDDRDDRDDHVLTGVSAPVTDRNIPDEPHLAAGRVVVFARLLNEDGHPITSREQAAEHQLLGEWEHVGKLCVCRAVLPPMPRWLPRSMTAGLLADMEENSPGSSTVHLVSVEFADGFLTVLHREELSFLPL